MSKSKKSKMVPPGHGAIDLEQAIRETILKRDARFGVRAYLFLYEALAWTQKSLGRDNPALDPADRHVSGEELLEGIREFASAEFGPLAPTVFRSWGIRSSSDFGEIVFSLVEAGLLGKTERDRREDFSRGFDIDAAFEDLGEGQLK